MTLQEKDTHLLVVRPWPQAFSPREEGFLLKMSALKQFVFAAAITGWADVLSTRDRVFVEGKEGWSCI